MAAIEFKTGANDAGRRLDRILRKSLPDCSLSLIHRLLRQGKVLVNDKPARPEDRIQSDVIIKIMNKSLVNHRPEAVNENNESNHKHFFVNHRSEMVNENTASNNKRFGVNYRSQLVNKQNVVNYRCQRVNENNASPAPLPEILMRERGIIVFNKPPGLSSHGKDSLDTMVKNRLAGELPPSLSFKPGPLHRLDRPTSGIIAFSESLEGARWFSDLLQERKVAKTYLAIVEGRCGGEEIWQDELVRNKTLKKTFAGNDGDAMNKTKNALTMVKSIASNGLYTLIEASIITGRTHQIRAQAASQGRPLAGDKKYGALPFPGGFYLHAWKMEFEGIKIIAPLPKAFLLRVHEYFGDTVRSFCSV